MIEIGQDTFINTPSARNLGFHYDEEFKNTIHINKLCCGQTVTIKKNTKERQNIDKDTTKTLMQALVLSKLDYCNSLLLGLNQYIITKLQQVQNMACHMIYNLKWSLPITPYKRDLHWLKISEHIQYKEAVYMYKCVYKTAPKYLQDLIQVQAELTQDQRTLRSHVTGKLPTSRSTLTQVHRCFFSSMGPRIWNDLPFNMRISGDINMFKKNLRTLLFQKSYCY